MPRTLILLLLLALAACDGAEPEAEGPSVERVLPGTVSDAMLQTDRMQAQAPIVEPVATGVPGEEDEFGSPTKGRRDAGAGPSREPPPGGTLPGGVAAEVPGPATATPPPKALDATPKAAAAPAERPST